MDLYYGQEVGWAIFPVVVYWAVQKLARGGDPAASIISKENWSDKFCSNDILRNPALKKKKKLFYFHVSLAFFFSLNLERFTACEFPKNEGGCRK